jgi:NADPH-dependent curcumin reductase CurA
MSTLFKRQIRLKSRPDGIPQAEHFELVTEPVPALLPGQVLVRNNCLSGGPASMRRMRARSCTEEKLGKRLVRIA